MWIVLGHAQSLANNPFFRIRRHHVTRDLFQGGRVNPAVREKGRCHFVLHQNPALPFHALALTQRSNQCISFYRARVQVIRTREVEAGVHPSQGPCPVPYFGTTENPARSDLFPVVPR